MIKTIWVAIFIFFGPCQLSKSTSTADEGWLCQQDVSLVYLDTADERSDDKPSSTDDDFEVEHPSLVSNEGYCCLSSNCSIVFPRIKKQTKELSVVIERPPIS